jgi:hypothetical protein
VSNNPTFRDLYGLTVLLKIGLAAYMAVAAISIWSGWLQIDILQRAATGVATEAEAAASDSRQSLVDMFFLLIYISTAILFLRWTYLTSQNARALGSIGMHVTPGWAIGWYFVPIAALWQPYQALREIFKASHPDFSEGWEQAPLPNLLPLWWTFWICGNVAGQAVLRSARRTETIDQLLASSWIRLISDALDLPLGILAMTIVAKLYIWQSEKYRRLGPVAASAPLQFITAEPQQL